MTKSNYEAQVRLLLRILTHVAAEDCFALKGGTAINLFVRDLPRLSVDIDLTYVPVEERSLSLRSIAEALERLRGRLTAALPGATIRAPTTAGEETKLVCLLGEANVKVEVNTVLRGVACSRIGASARGAVETTEPSQAQDEQREKAPTATRIASTVARFVTLKKDRSRKNSRPIFFKSFGYWKAFTSLVWRDTLCDTSYALPVLSANTPLIKNLL